ncbi:uncharacterized protein LOC113238890 [Hyposmocoma kahamanoa]|uniref:uncharacterized protein LOC113238890 n=1 Tax=Hyposmocoma kahamanoa TaxID=1477025 RepID=UPI000E6D7FAB|nr:uncharacterized protein LOC113238890 [Hyposmocoma kahamanoa]
MRKIKMAVKKKSLNKVEVIKPEDDIEVPDYRSIVTVKGTKEDVTNCILKAKRALENEKFDRAESLLLKAERIFPTKNARDLLKQIRAAREPKKDPNPIEIATEAVEQVDTIKEEESKSGDDSVNAVKCLAAFERAFSAGNFEKAERMLNKAKRFDAELNIERKLSQVKAAINKKIMEEKRKEQIEKAIREYKNAGECLYKSMKAYDAGDFVKAELILCLARIYDSALNLELELSNIRTKMASESSKENKDLDKTVPEETVTENDIKFAAENLYNAKKAYDTGDFKEAHRKFLDAKICDKSLNLEPYLSKCRAEIASRSSTEGNTAIPEKVSDTVTTYAKENIELNERNINEAEIAYQNRNLTFPKLAKPVYPCKKVNETLDHVENLKGKNLPKPSHEITNSETEFSCLEDEKRKEMEMKERQEIERRRKEVVEKEKSRKKKDDSFEINKTYEAQKRSLENEKEKTGTRVNKKTNSGRCKFSTDNKKQTADREKLQQVHQLVNKARQCINNSEFELAKVTLLEAASIHATPTVKSLMEEIEKSLENLKRTNYSSKYKGDYKTTKSPSKEEQVKALISLAEKAIDEKNFEDAMNFLNSAEELYPTDQAKELIKSINEIKICRDETSVQLNCYEFTIEANESDRAEALKCITMAQVAFQEGRNERAEHLLVKALRICDSQRAKTLLETVRNAKGQNNSSVKTEKSCEYGYDHSLNEYNLEYNKSIELAEKAIAEGDLDKAERFLSKAIRIYPNDKARKLLEHIKNVRSSHPSSDKTLKSDDYLKSEGEAEILIDRAIKAMTCEVFDLACFYLEWALEKQPNEHTKELLQEAKIKQNSCNRRSSQSKKLYECDANKLLAKAENLILDGDLKKAETFLIVSWDMNRSGRTTSVHKKFLEARMARFERDEKHKRDGTNNGNSKNIFESDKLVKTALEKIGKKNFEEAKELLMRAAEFYPKEKMKEAKKCIEIAENAISIENFVKAKRMLSKAERIHPTDTAQQLLKHIERFTLSNNNNEDENDVMAAQKCITIARIAIGNNNVVKAERFLLKSINIHSTDEAKELLEKLKNGYECNEPTRPTGTLETAEECIERAQNAFHEGNCKKALRLLTKSERIYPTSRAKDLLKQVKEKLSENGEDPDEVLKEVRKITVRKDAGAPPPPQPKKREVTSEQISEIQRVKQAKDDYDILGIPRGSDLNEVKKAYKYLTKVLHPDKNRAPGAKEAFMMAKEATDRLKLKLKSRK